MSDPMFLDGAASSAGQVPVFYIPATTSLQERRPRTLKHGDTFAVFDHNGDILQGPGSPEGLFHADTRRLSLCRLTIGGLRPLLLSSTLRADNATLTCDLTNPDLFERGRLVLERDVIHVRRTKFLWEGACYERLVIVNHSTEPRRVRLELSFAADFADLFEVRGNRRERRGIVHAPVVRPDRLILSYTGLDKVRRATTLRFDPPPSRLSEELALFELDLPPQGGCSVHLEVVFDDFVSDERLARGFRTALRYARHALRHASMRMASLSSSNEIFNEITRRTVADLCMLATDTPQGPYPYAGIPWFSAVFGRDALITALDPGLSADERAVVAARCDGVPFYIEQVVNGISQAGVPDTLYEPLFARLRASPKVVPVVEAAAVIGRHVDRDLLRSVVDLSDDAVDEVLGELEDARVLEWWGTDTWRFRHELLREIAAELAPPSVRRGLHAKVADALIDGAAEPDWQLVAGHYEHAERLDQAASAYERASTDARLRGALT